MHLIDLPAYFRRIGYQGGTTPDFETLSALHVAHTTSIVFENLENWNGGTPSLDPARIEEKLIHRGRGGYCFEMNTLFAAALSQLGFVVSTRNAWVQWMQPPGSRPYRNHMLLTVPIGDRRWMCDVGFGAIGQTVPLALDTDQVQATPQENRRFVFNNDIATHQADLGGGRWENLYSFDGGDPFPMDFEVANWYIAKHPDSLFRQTPLVTAVREDHRLSLAFGEFTRRFPDGTTEKHEVTTDDELRSILTGEFGLPADDPDVSRATLATPAERGL